MQKFVVKKSKSAPAEASINATESQTSTATSSSSKSPLLSSSMTVASQVKMSGYLKKKRNKMGGWRKLWFVLQNQLLLSYSSKEDYEKKLAPFKDVLNLVPGTIIRPTKGPRFIIETSTNLIYTYRCDNNKVCSEWVTALVESLALNSYSNGLDMKSPLIPNKLHFSLENLPKSNMRSSISSSPASSFMSSRSCDSIYRSKFCKLPPKLPVAENTARLLDKIQSPKTNSAVDTAQNFRLHQTDLNVNQSYEVHRINRMFNANNSNSSSKSNNHNNKNISSNNHRKSVHDSYYNKNVKIIDQKEQRNGFLDKNSNRDIIIMDSMKQTNGSGNRSLEDQMQRISLENEITSTPSSMGEASSLSSPSSTSSASSTASSVSNASTASVSNFRKKTPDIANSDDVVTAETHHTPASRSPVTSINVSEPIYAVVNLKNKYARRANRKEMEDDTYFRERPNSFHVISGDYEEVIQIGDCVDGPDDEENIYEPINIPEINARGPLWRYFSKINIDALVEITRWKKEQPKDESSTTFSDIRKRFGHHRKSIKNRMKNFYHRSNSDTQETCRINSIEHNELGSQGASCSSPSESDGKTTPEEKIQNKIGEQPENIIFRKRERHLFGSMLKKSRTSLCLEETAPRKKLIMAIGNGGGLKKKFNRSFEDKNKECHSKFYD